MTSQSEPLAPRPVTTTDDDLAQRPDPAEGPDRADTTSVLPSAGGSTALRPAGPSDHAGGHGPDGQGQTDEVDGLQEDVVDDGPDRSALGWAISIAINVAIGAGIYLALHFLGFKSTRSVWQGVLLCGAWFATCMGVYRWFRLRRVAPDQQP